MAALNRTSQFVGATFAGSPSTFAGSTSAFCASQFPFDVIIDPLAGVRRQVIDRFLFQKFCEARSSMGQFVVFSRTWINSCVCRVKTTSRDVSAVLQRNLSHFTVVDGTSSTVCFSVTSSDDLHLCRISFLADVDIVAAFSDISAQLGARAVYIESVPGCPGVCSDRLLLFHDSSFNFGPIQSDRIRVQPWAFKAIPAPRPRAAAPAQTATNRQPNEAVAQSAQVVADAAAETPNAPPAAQESEATAQAQASIQDNDSEMIVDPPQGQPHGSDGPNYGRRRDSAVRTLEEFPGFRRQSPSSQQQTPNPDNVQREAPRERAPPQ